MWYNYDFDCKKEILFEYASKSTSELNGTGKVTAE